MRKIKIIKYIHLYSSIIIFITLLMFTLHNKQLYVSNISLSKLGINENGWIWNCGIFALSTILYFKIKESIKKFINSITLLFLNKCTVISLMLTAIINMNYSFHNITAFLYFIFTSITMFIFGIKIHKTNFRIGQISLSIGILSIILPLLSFPVVGTLAIPEIIHISLLFLWLVILEHDTETINLIKKFGL
jgi:hypothetical membrane protein